ncbi:FAD/FMN-containing dehydrogenase [Sinobacterium caligoides]|uniref:FAD/FMN-containing dehydrogenase n=1 Tax=Sinobacterium caligoides TaxID=933926 RepID=A0A3N2DHK0_9GAMM|nr:FAD-binding oxidoreductase [Sinobacterium caligoides]ROR98864.1 FAD/FMN-containing dehydrogenase [Sinobacterium caligoides]
MTNKLSAAVIQSLKEIVGEDKLLLDDDDLQRYGRDWTRIYTPAPSVIVLPKTVEQVQAIVKLANREGFSLVPSGGRTGLSGGAVATAGEVVVAFDAMNQIRQLNVVDQSVVCEAGVITEQLQDYAAEHELFYPVDFASSGSSQIGGNIATNAGGIKVIRYGMTRDWVLGLKVVTGSGEILELNNGLLKNNAGYDMRQLFIGAEGTLGFIVEATMRLTRQPHNLNVLVLGVEQFSSIMNVLQAFQSKIDLTAFEFFSEKALQKVVEHQGLQRPFDSVCDYYALLEFESLTEQELEHAMTLFEYCMEQGWVVDGVLSQSLQQAQNLWRLREDISETLARWTPYKNDLSVHVSRVPEFIAEVDALVQAGYPDFEIVWFGHIGDGNAHLNILRPDDTPMEAFVTQCELVSKQIFEVVQRYAGSVSAEHGVGLLKKPYLQYSRSAVEIDYMRSLRQVFDPNGVMNPGKVFDQ